MKHKLTYGDWNISDSYLGYLYCHKDYDGPGGPQDDKIMDTRSGWGATIFDCITSINEVTDEEETYKPLVYNGVIIDQTKSGSWIITSSDKLPQSIENCIKKIDNL